jgi:hypothetical protein
LFKLFVSMKLYVIAQKNTYLKRFLQALFTKRDKLVFNYLSKVFLHLIMDSTPVLNIKKEEAALIKIPITIIAAKKNALSSKVHMIHRTQKIFPSLKITVSLESSKHVQSTANQRKTVDLLLQN